MNLIEQLGGYERAKHEFEMIKEMKSIYPGEIETNNRLLLEYRRQHNIFEVGDFVASKEWVDGSIHKVELVDNEDKTLKIFSHDMAFSYWVDSRKYQHANDEEIKARKRLEVKSDS